MTIDFTQITGTIKKADDNKGTPELDMLADIGNGSGTNLSFDSAQTYAGYGAALGSVVPGIGNVVGGALGFYAGFVSDNFDSIETFITGGGGNIGNDYPYLELWRYAKGGERYMKPYQIIKTNKNYYNTDFSRSYKPYADFLKISLPQMIKETETVLTMDTNFIANLNLPSNWGVFEWQTVFNKIHEKYLTLPKNNTGGSVAPQGGGMVQIGGSNNLNSGSPTQITPQQMSDNNFTQKSPIAMLAIAIVALFLIFK